MVRWSSTPRSSEIGSGGGAEDGSVGGGGEVAAAAVTMVVGIRAGGGEQQVGLQASGGKNSEHEEGDNSGVGGGDGHPYDFHVCGPRNLSSPNWRDLFHSSWKDLNYKRMVIACFIQAVYLLELDRQEKKSEENGLAPKWWKPFKYKLVQTLVDERDGSIFGGLLEWDRAAALSEFIVKRPNGAPRAILALRGTLLKSPTIRRDLEDDLRFLTWESLKGSFRFKVALEALKSVVEKYGSNNVCIGGHSLGAGFALQVGKALAEQGIFVECHLFNPPSVSLAMSVRSIREKAVLAWKRIKTVFPVSDDAVQTGGVETTGSPGMKVLSTEVRRWVPNLYVNSSDYICCYYTNSTKSRESNNDTGGDIDQIKADDCHGRAVAKLFLTSKGPQKFLEAHGLQQWWSDDVELQLALHQSKLINRQLRSLYAPSLQTPQC